MSHDRKLEMAARDVVERCRAGDQVAMGVLVMVRENAKKGQPKAKQSLRAIKRYIAKNPPNAIGAEVSGITNPSQGKAVAALWTNPTSDIVVKALPIVGFWQGVTALVHGPRLDNVRLSELQSKVEEKDRNDFCGGIMFWRKKAPPIANPDERGWLMGRIVGIARVIQRLQIPSVPISTYCPATAWELGE